MWWLQVTVTPLINRILVFNRGTWKGSIEITLKGGHLEPKSFPGFKLLWKKAQNQALKNIISLKINKSIPHLNPSPTSKLWDPESLSRLVSRHQLNIKIITRNKKIIKKKIFLFLNITKIFKIILIIKNDINKGQGLKLTIWNLWKLILKNI